MAVATTAEARKREKCTLLSRSHHFVPVAIETSGALTLMLSVCSVILAGVSRLLHAHDHQSLSFLLQRVSIAFQQGNAASVLGTSSVMFNVSLYMCILLYISIESIIIMIKINKNIMQ